MKTLKGRLWLLGCALFTLAGSISILYYSWVEMRVLKEEAVEQIRFSTEQHHAFIDHWYEHRMADIRSLAKLDWLNNPNEVSQFLRSYSREKSEFEFITFFDQNGEGFISTFEAAQYRGKHVRDRDYFKAAIKGEDYSSDVVMNRVTNAPVMIFATPLRDPSGDIRGIVSGGIKMEFVNELINHFQLGQTGEMLLVNKHGQLLTIPRLSGELSERPRILETKVSDSFLSSVVSAQAYSHTDYRGKEVYGIGDWTNDKKWIVIGKIDRSEVMKPFLTRMIYMTLGLLVFLIIFIILIFRVSKTVERPLQKLVTGTGYISGGDYSYRILSQALKSAPIEMVRLVEHFNMMAAALESKESLLEQSRQRIYSLVDYNRDAVYALDTQGRFTDLNQACSQLTGYSMEELNMTVFSALMVKSELPNANRIFQRTLEGSSMDFETTILHKEGHKLNLHVTSIPIKVNGEVVGVYGIAKDITAVKHAQSKLAYQAKELERSNRDLQQFAYIASHDLQEPLRMISSYLQLLEKRYKDQLDQDAIDFIWYAVDGSKRMQTLINDLLAYSRVETKGKSFDKVDMGEVVKKASQNLQKSVEEKSASIHYSNLPLICADHTQMLQLLQNLISNGIKFTTVSQPEIRISAIEHEGAWEFAVQDNGIGIAEEHVSRIFEIFQRLHTRAEYPGTGIGLAICKKIVERHNGTIWVESVEGAGTTFRFTISKQGENKR
ncbi:ATP-binding protein [Paenibacillus turpanensis]|uniref:ATP-binding protein n=1 Tax=Paenibacillus turpanensis TaxID=2689078 RepID=UPI00140E36F8|nr:ATP-binding protein [Paenibacillus turpanensis]